MTVREGEVLAGKYRIDKVLGAGGMGVVVAAHHVDLDERVAIKFLLPEALANAEAVARFAREARAAVKIKSEHVARVTDVGKLDNGSPYMVMEYLEGSDLAAWLSRRGPLPIEQAVEFVLQASEAIAEAHMLGIVHRDLKPANLFVIRTPNGTLSVKVLDFGISKTTGLIGSAGDGAMTKTSALMGSPFYMSPEQMQSSKDVDSRGDIWALGVVLYELLAGSAPFIGETVPELILRVMSKEPRPLRSQRPDTPEGLEAVILKCLEKDRSKRIQTVAQLAVALLPFAPKRSKISVERISGLLGTGALSTTVLELPPLSSTMLELPSLSGAPGAFGAGPVEPSAGTAASWGRTASGTRRGPWLAVAGFAIAATAAAAAVLFTHQAVPPAPATSASRPSATPVLLVPPGSAAATVSAPVLDSAIPAGPALGSVASSAPVSAPATAVPPKRIKQPGAARAVSIAAKAPAAGPAPAPINPSKPADEWGEGRL
jgi:eukaryotic-like serine/threonine-protein kinase